MIMRKTSKTVAFIGTGLAAVLAAAGCSSPAMSDQGEARAEAKAADRQAASTERGSALVQDAQAELQSLYQREEGAKAIGEQARGILVFPKVSKAGFVVGGEHGKGVLFKDGEVAGHYTTTAASWGLQAGAQQYGYAMFFMNEKALEALDNARGWEVGVGPNVVVLDKGAATKVTTATLDKDIYGFIFDQKGLMAGVGLQGSKIQRVKP